MSTTINNEVLYNVTAQRGSTLRCKGWKQETILRMLENNMEVAEHPERLVIYGGIGKCARNWESYHAIVAALKALENNETLVIQSGMPVAVFRTHRLAPRVVMATTNFVRPSWQRVLRAAGRKPHDLCPVHRGAVGVHRHPGRDPGHLRDAAIGRQHPPGRLARQGKILLCAGMGGMGGNQPRAMTMLGGVAICCDVDRRIIDRRMEVGYADVVAGSLDEAIALAQAAAERGEPLGITLEGNAVDVFEECLRRGVSSRHRHRDDARRTTRWPTSRPGSPPSRPRWRAATIATATSSAPASRWCAS